MTKTDLFISYDNGTYSISTVYRKLDITLEELPLFIDNSTADYHLNIESSCLPSLETFLKELATMYCTTYKKLILKVTMHDTISMVSL